MIKSESYDEETARENKAMRKRHALNQDRCHQPIASKSLVLIKSHTEMCDFFDL